MEWTIDKIIEESSHKSAGFLNTMHSCREGHPLFGKDGNPFRNASFMAHGRVRSDAIDWLNKRADEYDARGN